MRDPLLAPLFAEISSLPGVGPSHAKALARLIAHPEGTAEPRLIDLLLHLPAGFVDRRARPKVRDAKVGEIATLRVAVERHRGRPQGSLRAPYRIDASDETGTITLVYFNASRAVIDKLLPVGATRWVSGKVEMYDGFLQMVHPDRVVPEDREGDLAPIEVVYPLTEGVTQGVLARAVAAAIKRLELDRGVAALPEWLPGGSLPPPARGRSDGEAVRVGVPSDDEAERPPPGSLRESDLPLAGGGEEAPRPSFTAARARLHRRGDVSDLEPAAPAHLRLAHDELLANQLALGLVRMHHKRSGGRASGGTGAIAKKIEAALPFRLTGAQTRALGEIRKDIGSPERMLRLLQGDVGSGKTVVALLAAATVVESGRQAVLMAPTEILARQHLATIVPLAEAGGLRVELLTGRERGRERERILSAVAAGETQLLVGTHALFQAGVAFRDLGLAIVDEQHRFGVQQRLALTKKGDGVDVLVMTATPIPRTLVMTYFGDMDSSALDEKPPGRTPVDTRLVSLDRLDEVVSAIGRAIASGARVYWVCPLVEASEELDVAAAEERQETLEAIFPGKVGLVHGRMKGVAKDAALQKFIDGSVPILVATTVIEVGVDVPTASVMVIEHAERFGLAQLHQLRGRIGRGAARSTCLLLYRAPLAETAEARLRVMRDTDDGFVIAEKDLELRGQGEVLGTRQSGSAGFRIARLEVHGALLRAARADADRILASDPLLVTPRGRALRLLLQIFERQEAARLISAG